MNKYEKMLEAVSRTFTLSINQLPGGSKDAITLSYLLLRVSDCLEDHEDIPVDRKIKLLDLWHKILDGKANVDELTDQIVDLDSEDPEVYVAQQAGVLLERLETYEDELKQIILNHVKDTTTGMARWQKQGPFIQTEEDMDDYMHEVAGRVGYLITDIFAHYSPRIKKKREELLPLSREYGLALQTVNILRGMKKDYERGWVFTPQVYLDEVGITRDQLFKSEYYEQSVEVVNMLAKKAEGHLKHGLKYIAAFPRHQHRIRLACMWPLFFAVKTLQLSVDNVQVIADEVKMTREDVKDIMSITAAKGWSNQWLNKYYVELLQPQPNSFSS